nr:PREDICTED: V-set and immunoglobulin domain-containing protein 1 [Latimeria chalumnae]|eukprot:XP_014345256.1 PREDICTED: V-set and immunoglobulin domain-containing protein 1 [Latimeria chalumnae]
MVPVVDKMAVVHWMHYAASWVDAISQFVEGYFFIFILGSVFSLNVEIKDSKVNVTVGKSVTLYCTFTSTVPVEKATIEWDFYQAKSLQYSMNSPCPTDHSLGKSSVNQCPEMEYSTDARGRCSWKSKIYYSQNGSSYSLGEFKDRIKGAKNPGNATITISNMMPSDSGVYLCQVTNAPDFEGKNNDKVFVFVLVKPSKPHCSIRGPVETGDDVSLACYSEEGTPRPTYIWQKLTNGVPGPATGYLNPNKGTLLIGNLSSFETGRYLCTASNSLGIAACTLDLSIGSPDDGAIAGAIIGVIVAVAVIGIIIWYVLEKRKKRKHKKGKADGAELQATRSQKGGSTKYSEVPKEDTLPVNASLAAAHPSMEASAGNEPRTEAAAGTPREENSAAEAANQKLEEEGEGQQSVA